MNGNAPASPAWDALCATCAARLQAQGALAAFALLLSVLAWAGAAATAIGRWPNHEVVLTALVAAGLVGLAERYLAVRLVLDARLFADLAHGRIADLAMLDQALAQLRLAPAAKAGRALAARTAGALRLVKWHSRVVALQLALLAAALGLAAGARP